MLLCRVVVCQFSNTTIFAHNVARVVSTIAK